MGNFPRSSSMKQRFSWADNIRKGVKKLRFRTKAIIGKVFYNSITNYFTALAFLYMLKINRENNAQRIKKLRNYTIDMDKISMKLIRKTTPELTWKNYPNGGTGHSKILIDRVWAIRNTKMIFLTRLLKIIWVLHEKLHNKDLTKYLAMNLVSLDHELSMPQSVLIPLTNLIVGALRQLL